MSKIIKIKLGDLIIKSKIMNQNDPRYIKDTEKYANLEKSLECGYKPEQYTQPVAIISSAGYICISSKNVVLDGNHRAQILKEIYGDDHQIDVQLVSKFIEYMHGPNMILLMVITAIFDIIKLPFSMFFAKKSGLRLEIGFRGKTYEAWEILLKVTSTIILAPFKLIIYLDKWTFSKVYKIYKIIQFSKINPYKDLDKKSNKDENRSTTER